MLWVAFAFGSAFFAGITAILAKIGIRDVDFTLATALRTVVILLFSWLMVFVVGSQGELRSISSETIAFLVLSGLSTGASWLCYFKALQLGNVNKVTPIDKSSTVLTIVREQREGLIMNVISTAAYRVMEHSAIYSATKAAVRAFSEGLRKEETNHGIRVCLIAPGPVKTELLSHVSDDDIRASLDRYVQQHGMRAETVAEAMIFQMRVEKEASVDELILSPSIKGL